MASTPRSFTGDPTQQPDVTAGQSMGTPRTTTKGGRPKKAKAPKFGTVSQSWGRDPNLPYQDPKTGAYSGPGYVMATTGLNHDKAFQLYMAYKYATATGGFQGGLDEYIALHGKQFGVGGAGGGAANTFLQGLPNVLGQVLGPALASIMRTESGALGGGDPLVARMLGGAGQFGRTAQRDLSGIAGADRGLLGAQMSQALATPALDALLGSLNANVQAQQQGVTEAQRALAAGMFPTNAFLNAATAPGASAGGFGGTPLNVPSVPGATKPPGQ